MLQTIDTEAPSIQATKNKKNQDVSTSASSSCGDCINRYIKNLSSVVTLAKSKKPNFVKSNSFGTELFSPGVKKAFIHL